MSNVTHYDKLIRDNIPDIIEEAGHDYEVEKLGDDEYQKALVSKLQEEVDEFKESEETEELADIVEVIRALLHAKASSWFELETIRKEKQKQRGGFENKLLLKWSEDQ